MVVRTMVTLTDPRQRWRTYKKSAIPLRQVSNYFSRLQSVTKLYRGCRSTLNPVQMIPIKRTFEVKLASRFKRTYKGQVAARAANSLAHNSISQNSTIMIIGIIS